MVAGSNPVATNSKGSSVEPCRFRMQPQCSLKMGYSFADIGRCAAPGGGERISGNIRVPTGRPGRKENRGLLRLAAVLAVFILEAPARHRRWVRTRSSPRASRQFAHSRSFGVVKANEAGKGQIRDQVRSGDRRHGERRRDGVSTWCTAPARSTRRCPDACAGCLLRGRADRARTADSNRSTRSTRNAWPVPAGWPDSGIRFNLWATKKLDARNLDICGFKVRGHPIYNAFHHHLGAQVITLNARQPRLGATMTLRVDADRHHGRQLGPLSVPRRSPFFHRSVIVSTWKAELALAEVTRDPHARGDQHEQSSVKDLTDLRTKEYAEFRQARSEGGDAAARGSAVNARAASLTRMKERKEKSGGMENYPGRELLSRSGFRYREPLSAGRTAASLLRAAA